MVGSTDYGHQYYAYLYDPQGNLIQRQAQTNSQTNSQTDVLDTVLYDAYGQASADLDETTDGIETYTDPVGFGGQYGYYTDTETGMSLLTNRYYDAGRGRFITRDPIGYGGGINLYGFCGNNPVMGSDPDGTDPPGGSDPTAYFNTLFSYATPRDWLHIAAHNVVTRAVGTLVDAASYFIFPEAKGAEVAVEVATKVNCFVAGTPVQMADGSVKSIEQVSISDWVMSRDPSTGETEAKQVSAVYHQPVAQVLTLGLADCQTGQVVQTLTCTPGHPFYVDGQGFVLAGQLALGNAIVTRAGPDLLVKSIDWWHDGDGEPRGAEVYNFSVDGDHTYFVGTSDGGVWVHNNSYPAFFEMVLDHADWGTTGGTHFKKANEALLAAWDKSPILRSRLATFTGKTEAQVKSAIQAAGSHSPVVIDGQRIGFTWHHALASQAGGRRGVMQLVGFAHHADQLNWLIYHPGNRGGFAEWARPLGARR